MKKTAPNKFNKAMADARLHAGFSLERAARKASVFLPEHAELSTTMVRRLEGKGDSPTTDETCSTLHVWALAQAYGVPLIKLAPKVRERLQEEHSLFQRAATSRYPHSRSDQHEYASREAA